MNQKVSIIIPIYNVNEYLRRCLDTVINQTYRNIEIILINDGSTDNSLEIINEYKNKDNRIIVIDKKNTGASDSRNIGMSIATGDYISFVDSDDWLEIEMISKMVEQMEKNNVEAVRCNYYRNFDNDTQKIGFNYDDSIKNTELKNNKIIELVLPQVLSGRMPSYMWLLLIKKEAIYKVKPFNVNLSMMEDTIFFVDLLLNLKSIYIYDCPLYHYYLNKNSVSKSINNYLRNLNNVLEVNKLMQNMLENKYEKYELIYNTAHTKSIENFCFRLYKSINNKR